MLYVITRHRLSPQLFPQAALPSSWAVGGSVKFPTFNYSCKTYVRQGVVENLFDFVKSTQKRGIEISNDFTERLHMILYSI